jgi:hypothetical protein
MVVLSKNKKSFCALKYFHENAFLKLTYVVSGENESIIHATISNEKDENFFNKEKESSGTFQTEIKESGQYKLCFNNLAETDVIVSFDYVNDSETSHISKIAKDDVFSAMNKNLTDMSAMFDQLEHALKFYVERSNSHNNCKI